MGASKPTGWTKWDDGQEQILQSRLATVTKDLNQALKSLVTASEALEKIRDHCKPRSLHYPALKWVQDVCDDALAKLVQGQE